MHSTKRHRKGAPIHRWISQMPARARAAPELNWELRTQSCSLVWVIRTQLFDPSLLSHRIYISKKLESESRVRN